jgi:type VI secretion system secreted protein VgrG
MPRARRITIQSPLDPANLLVRSAVVTEHLGQLYEMEVELLSPDEKLPLNDLLGKGFTLLLSLPDDSVRYFHGLVSEFSQSGRLGRYACYSVTVVPWLWLLTRASNCRIFQKKSVPDILKEVFRKHGVSDFDDSLSSNYSPRDYCVQYMETDFNFVSRLMEDEGIYYFFRHEQDKHTLVLCDGVGAHSTTSGFETVPYFPPSENSVREQDHINDWELSQSIQSGKLAHTDYDFTKPRTSLMAQCVVTRDYPKSDSELYEYPGGHVTVSEGERYAQRQLESIQQLYERVSGEGNARGLTVGSLFTLDGFPREDQNREYLLVSTVHHFKGTDFESGVADEEGDVEVEFEAVPSRQPYRSPLVTPKSRVAGPQTAVVVGKSGEEIWTDQYGRVTVQFHWDRDGKKDENSSCWVRVSQLWAGKNWGAMHIPRIGQEVVVDFLEGDPDQPLITGRVYNAVEMPPYDLPANQTQSGVKSRSSKSGTPDNFNEIRFEDKKGSEQVYIHAEKNQDIVVENDETHSVGHDRSKSIGHDEKTTVGHDRNESVGNNETIAIAVNRTETVGSNETITIGSNRKIAVGASESATVALQRTHTVGVNESITVGAAQEITVGAGQTITVGAGQANTIGADQTTSVGANRSINVGSDQSVTIGGNASMNVASDEARAVGGERATSIGKDDSLSVTNNLNISAGDSVTITTGDASISMKKDGTITIKGKDITVDGSGKINIKASSDVVIKGSKVGIN